MSHGFARRWRYRHHAYFYPFPICLEPTALTLVFVETKRGAADLSYHLHRDGYNVVAIHGDLKQFEREKHLETFRHGIATIMVATAVRTSTVYPLKHGCL